VPTTSDRERVRRHQQAEQENCHQPLRDHPHAGHQRAVDDLVDLGEHRRGEIRAVPVEEPLVRLAQVPADQPDPHQKFRL
jgi:hypothetical protein